jgi:hypothetical protein
VLSHPAAMPLSTRSLNYTSPGLIRAHRSQRRSRWRRLGPGVVFVATGLGIMEAYDGAASA